jgi:hypothetical protein
MENDKKKLWERFSKLEIADIMKLDLPSAGNIAEHSSTLGFFFSIFLRLA